MPKAEHAIQLHLERTLAECRGDGKFIDKGVRNVLVLSAICLLYVAVVFSHEVVDELKAEEDQPITLPERENGALADRADASVD